MNEAKNRAQRGAQKTSLRGLGSACQNDYETHRIQNCPNLPMRSSHCLVYGPSIESPSFQCRVVANFAFTLPLAPPQKVPVLNPSTRFAILIRRECFRILRAEERSACVQWFSVCMRISCDVFLLQRNGGRRIHPKQCPGIGIKAFVSSPLAPGRGHDPEVFPLSHPTHGLHLRNDAGVKPN